MSLLEVKNLRVSFFTGDGEAKAVDGVSFDLREGEILGIVGESGSGKSTVAHSIMGHPILSRSAKILGGEIIYQGKDLLKLSSPDLRKIRGKEISMIFQDPSSSLNPLMTVERQIEEIREEHKAEIAKWHRENLEISFSEMEKTRQNLKGIKKLFYKLGMFDLKDFAVSARIEDLLKEVRIPESAKRVKQRPFEMSMGMNQRIMIAMMALSCHPKILLADEPTTALDVTVQAQVLKLIKDLAIKHNLAVILITHNFGVVAEYADRIAVLRRGKIVEIGSVFDVFSNPRHSYTRKLFEVIPRLDRELAEKTADSEDSLIEVRNLKVYFPIFSEGVFKEKLGEVKAVDDITFKINKGQIIGLVGESGCGKSTLARAILGLVPIDSGRILFGGREISVLGRREFKKIRRSLQMVFQDASMALNPRIPIGDSIIEAAEINRLVHPRDRMKKIEELLGLVKLDSKMATRLPLEFSSGQRQRVGIARALAMNPDFLILDEPVSTLDVSIQADILSLLLEIKERFNLTYLFISHDLAVVRQVSDKIFVMYLGKFVEFGDSREIYKNPLHPYTRALISATPIPDPLTARRKERILLKGDVPSPFNPPAGCRFHTRCAECESRCKEEEPVLRNAGGGHLVACHKVF